MFRPYPTASIHTASINRSSFQGVRRLLVAIVLTCLDAAVLGIYCAPLFAVAVHNFLFLVLLTAVLLGLFVSLGRVWSSAIPIRKS